MVRLIALITDLPLTLLFRYLFEIGEHSESLRLSNVALKTTEKGTLIHAQLENSLYGLYSFQNDLGRARPLLESAYAFMKNHLGEDSAEYISPNMGNLLAAEGQTEAALEMFLIVEKRRNEIKKPQNIGLAFLNLGIGRAQMVMRNLEEAERRFKAAFKVVREEHGEKGQFMQE